MALNINISKLLSDISPLDVTLLICYQDLIWNDPTGLRDTTAVPQSIKHIVNEKASRPCELILPANYSPQLMVIGEILSLLGTHWKTNIL